MSMQPCDTWEVPEETRRVAKAAFPKGNVYIRIRDELGELYPDSLFAELFPVRGQPAESPGRLAWVTVMQFAEGLSDRQAADAVRGRMDWKYALGLELTDPGFDYSVLSEFRQRLVENQKAHALLDALLRELRQRGLLKARGQQRTDSTHVLAVIRAVNRLELVGETMRRALNELAQAAPDWVRSIAKAEWFIRYGRRFDTIRLPKGREEREQLIETIGADGAFLLSAVHTSPGADQLRQLPGVEMLRRVWVQQYWVENQADGQGRIRLRTNEHQPPGEQRIHSPYDAEARYSAKRETEWVGYKVHLTETCDDDSVHLITHVETTSAVVPDVAMPDKIHASLAEKELLPSRHLIDAGYVAADLLVEAKRDLDIEVCGPAKQDVRWQAKRGQGFGLSEFKINWEAKQATCPKGQASRVWSEHRNAYDQAVVQIAFKPSICRACPDQTECTRSKRGNRTLVVRPQAQHTALQALRQEQETAAFRKRYAKRSGIEGTISEGVRGYDLRHTRYLGLAKTDLQMLATATAINFHRLFDWLMEAPRSATRVSRFARLAPEPSLIRTGWYA
jgi:transposase